MGRKARIEPFVTLDRKRWTPAEEHLEPSEPTYQISLLVIVGPP